MLNEQLARELLGGVPKKRKKDPLHVKQPSSIIPWTLNEQLTHEQLGDVTKQETTIVLHVKQTALDNPVVPKTWGC